jgi:antitoxin component YwqK of YwqJK toxin-antitoxin module
LKKRTTENRDGKTVIYEDGILHAEWPIGDGVSKYYHPNGLVRHEAPVVNGATHGIVREWHDNGQRASEVRYVMGEIQGTKVCWDRKGLLSQTLDYVLPNAICGTTYADVGRVHRMYLWNGKPISKARWLKKLEAAGVSIEEVQRRLESREKVSSDGSAGVAGNDAHPM